LARSQSHLAAIIDPTAGTERWPDRRDLTVLPDGGPASVDELGAAQLAGRIDIGWAERRIEDDDDAFVVQESRLGSGCVVRRAEDLFPIVDVGKEYRL
jgi:hypothetical protein